MRSGGVPPITLSHSGSVLRITGPKPEPAEKAACPEFRASARCHAFRHTFCTFRKRALEIKLIEGGATMFRKTLFALVAAVGMLSAGTPSADAARWGFYRGGWGYPYYGARYYGYGYYPGYYGYGSYPSYYGYYPRSYGWSGYYPYGYTYYGYPYYGYGYTVGYPGFATYY
jgi:hypothetical protein